MEKHDKSPWLHNPRNDMFDFMHMAFWTNPPRRIPKSMFKTKWKADPQKKRRRKMKAASQRRNRK